MSTPASYPRGDLRQFISPRLEGVSFHLNPGLGEFDAWFVLEEAMPNDAQAIIPDNRLFYLNAETARDPGFYYETAGWLDYLGQFTEVFTPLQYYVANGTPSLPFLPWMINANHGKNLLDSHRRDFDYFDKLKNIKKTRKLSIVCSTKTITSQHRLRLRFVEKLAEELGDQLHWFGNGKKEVRRKWEAIAPYEGTIVLENQASQGILTEKIQDAFLALSIPFYWGAPDAFEIFPGNSFFRINILDFDESLETIRTFIEDGVYLSHLPDLLSAKSTVLTNLNFALRMYAISTDPSRERPGPMTLTTLEPLHRFSFV